MISITDSNGTPFDLLKYVARDKSFYASKKEINWALKNEDSFGLFLNKSKRRTHIYIWPYKTRDVIALGCHEFQGRAKATLLKWLRS